MAFFTCCGRHPEDKERRLSGRSEEFKKAIKILLLGTGESGKSTVLKQMKIIHVKGFSDREKREQVAVIRENLHDSVCEILRNVEKLGLAFECCENEDSAKEILDSPKDDERFNAVSS